MEIIVEKVHSICNCFGCSVVITSVPLWFED